ncbi:unnamed protein product [Periconia digitata]|uniref:Rab-GAP TBC domain-containing protein n=1 Tax=Periconia digitata TaxID=1303443 RepID=A0A9W4XGE2_9PLEO|nr:unnamed protein product [Periconia digitata]
MDGNKSVEAGERAPRTHIDSKPLPTDSMVTVPLSESDGLHTPDDDNVSPKLPQPEILVDEKRLSSRPNSAEIMAAFGRRASMDGSTTPPANRPSIALQHPDGTQTPTPGERHRSNSSDSSQSAHVDWAELDKKEELEPQEEGQDEAMALLLARLEQENNAIMADSKANMKVARARSQSRPPSISQIKRLVQTDNTDVRFSQLPSPPPMTELEFWAALVRDYPQTIQRLPTLTLNKIRGGIPAPLRGVVWQSASGARAKLIEDQYDQLCGESSPYENIINKDLGRSFPGVEMFKDPEGEGQKMLGRVLKCFSLYDSKIGYCQGLGFLVGPLLMQMGDKEAFCVLVRLMEDYDLRSCFLPDLSGLHLRIFQFQRLLQQHMPKLAAHLEFLQVESAYLSQWFLSFFAVTCPLPMLFRIYDVLFAEGASETIMRVALALMKRNEAKILALSEFEDVMQLLLGRSLWDPYGRNAKSADDLVNDFVSFTNDVTREKLQGLEASFREEQERDNSKSKVQKSATSFLGRLWGPSNSSTKSVSLSPDGSDMSTHTQSTALTEISRGSTGDALSLKSGHESTAMSIRMGHSSKDRDLHYQIEQLLMSVSQLQRQNSEIEAALQKQREDRKEDHRIVRTVVDKFRKKQSSLGATSTRASRRRTTITAAMLTPPNDEEPPTTTTAAPEEVVEAAEVLDKRFPSHQTHHRASSMFETKEVLRDNLSRTKEQLASETIRAQTIAREMSDTQADLAISREALKDTRQRLQDSYNQNQKLEKTIQDLRLNARKGSAAWIDGTPDSTPSLSRSNTTDSVVSTGGLRELRLGRTASMKSQKGTQQFTKRSSSLATQQFLGADAPASSADNEALLLELVNAKTAEAVARQELEEYKNKFESMKKMMANGGATPAATPTAESKTAAAGSGWSWGIGTSSPSSNSTPTASSTATAAPPPAATTVSPTPSATVGGGGGWGWAGWKRTPSTTNATIKQ